MFEALKKKLSSWLSTDKKEKKSKKKVSKKTSGKEEKSYKTSKGKKSKKIIPQQKITPANIDLENKELTEEFMEEKESAQVAQEDMQIEKKEADELEKERLEKVREEIQEETKEELKKESFFSKILKKISNNPLSKEQFDELFYDLELTLLENNVALEVVDKIRESLSDKLVGHTLGKENAQKKIFSSLKESIEEILIEPQDIIKQIREKEGIFTIIFFGINGTGKTTSVAKLAHKLKKEGFSCVLAAADTFRAASIEQLQKHADNLKVPLVRQAYGSDPAAVAFDAKKYAEKHKIKVVLVDTAGRMYTKQNLIREMEKVIRVTKPDLKIFVGESITGNDVVEQAKTFNEAIGIDGIILSKADVDEKAGAVLSVSFITKKPIYFLGIGQNYTDLEDFSKKKVIKNLGLE